MQNELTRQTMSDIIQVQMLGGFKMKIGDKIFCDSDNHSKQMWNLLEYLIVYRHETIASQNLVESLWPEDKSNNPANALKNLIYRIRTMFLNNGVVYGRELISYAQSCYSWNNQFFCEVDTEQFENLCQRASDEQRTCEERIALYLRALAFYKGNFLPNSSYRAWAMPFIHSYQSLYFESLYNAAQLLLECKRFEDLERICKKAIAIDRFEERAHQYFIRSLLKQGKQSEALAHYNELTDLFYRELGISVSQEIRNLYREIVKTMNHIETDLSVIKEDLSEHEKVQGAFLCEYEIFKCMYRVEARTAARSGQSVFVALLTITDASNQVPEAGLLSKAMDCLVRSTCHSLRKGDIVSRFSATQYVLMLPTLTFENCQSVLARIVKRFKFDFRSKEVKLHTTLQPLEPLL